MKPYNFKLNKVLKFSKWIDLDHVLEISEFSGDYFDGGVSIRYQLAFLEKESEIYFRNPISSKCVEFLEEFREEYNKFLEAWKNKDVINVSKDEYLKG